MKSFKVLFLERVVIVMLQKRDTGNISKAKVTEDFFHCHYCKAHFKDGKLVRRV
jgi:uncharacterized protein YwbE